MPKIMSNNGIGSLFLALLSAMGILSKAYCSDLPEGWRYPSEKDLADDFIRNQSNEKYVDVTADFNGDGKDDYAYLVKSTRFSGEALLARISKDLDYDWVILHQIEWGNEYPEVGLAMGIELVVPGEYKTACGKGYWECKEDEVPLLQLNLPAINYFRFASAASYFFWEENAAMFKRIWISD